MAHDKQAQAPAETPDPNKPMGKASVNGSVSVGTKKETSGNVAKARRGPRRRGSDFMNVMPGGTKITAASIRAGQNKQNQTPPVSSDSSSISDHTPLPESETLGKNEETSGNIAKVAKPRGPRRRGSDFMNLNSGGTKMTAASIRASQNKQHQATAVTPDATPEGEVKSEVTYASMARRGSHCMDFNSGGNKITAASIRASQNNQPQAPATDPMDVETNNERNGQPVASASTARKNPRRRGSDCMDFNTGGGKLTAASIRAGQNNQPQAPATESMDVETNNDSTGQTLAYAEMAKKNPRRRGSDCMDFNTGGPKLTAASIRACQNNQPQAPATEPMDVETNNDSTGQTVTARRGPRRRGSDFMNPNSGGGKLTAASIRASQNNQPKAPTVSAGKAATVSRGPRRRGSDFMNPNSGGAKITAASIRAGQNKQPQAPPASSIQPSMTESSRVEKSEENNGEAVAVQRGPRRRGSDFMGTNAGGAKITAASIRANQNKQVQTPATVSTSVVESELTAKQGAKPARGPRRRGSDFMNPNSGGAKITAASIRANQNKQVQAPATESMCVEKSDTISGQANSARRGPRRRGSDFMNPSSAGAKITAASIRAGQNKQAQAPVETSSSIPQQLPVSDSVGAERNEEEISEKAPTVRRGPRRRGSDFMNPTSGGAKITAASIRAGQNKQAQLPVTDSTGAEGNEEESSGKAPISRRGPRRRGSDFMNPTSGGAKITAASIRAGQNKQAQLPAETSSSIRQQLPVTDSTGAEGKEEESSGKAPISRRGPRRRGSDFMNPTSGGAKITAASIRAGQNTQDPNKTPPDKESTATEEREESTGRNDTPSRRPRRRGSVVRTMLDSDTISQASPTTDQMSNAQASAVPASQIPTSASAIKSENVVGETATAPKGPRRRGSDFMNSGGAKITAASIMAGGMPQAQAESATLDVSTHNIEPSPEQESVVAPSVEDNRNSLEQTQTAPKRSRRRGSGMLQGDVFTPSISEKDQIYNSTVSGPPRRGSVVRPRTKVSGPGRVPSGNDASALLTTSRQDDTREIAKRQKRKERAIGRKAVRAISADVDYVKKVVPKSDYVREMIYEAIKPNILFKACDEEELQDLIDAFEPKSVNAGSIVIQEGDEGDHFYVMERGGVNVYENDVFKCSLFSGVAFGEIALLYGCPRSATLEAKYDCSLWSIDRRAYRGISVQHKQKRLNLKMAFLSKVKIHNKILGEMLKKSELHAMALATENQTFEDGEAIVTQGEKGETFYMIEEGTVDVFILEKGLYPVVTLSSGQFFGEKALLSDDVRTATCIASSHVKCMVLMREDFVLMLGSMEDLLNRSYEVRKDSVSSISSDVTYSGGDNSRIFTFFDMSEFEVKRTLGVGAFGFVKLVKWKASTSDEDDMFALKRISQKKIEQLKQEEKIVNEAQIMKELYHPFIVRCFSAMQDAEAKYFLMEALCGGEICELLFHEEQFSEEWTRFYAASVIHSLCYMHQKKIAYRDLKTENLVLNAAGYMKLVDFGLAKKIPSGKTWTFCGTPDYLAPEIILNEGHDWAVDYWALGVLLFEMASGTAPFTSENPMNVYKKVLSGEVTVPDYFSIEIEDLIAKLLNKFQSKRFGRTMGGGAAVMQHAWFVGFDWDALLDYRMEVPIVPTIKHEDDNSFYDGVRDSFAQSN